MKKKSGQISRRSFIKTSGALGAGFFSLPYLNCGRLGVSKPMTRSFGRIPFEPTTLGLGGQASLQWTPDGVDPVQIILKAFDVGLTYFDTSNLYNLSQTTYGKAFQKLGLIPGQSSYNASLRESIFLTSKTHLRWAKGQPKVEGLNNWSNGQGAYTIDDLKRSLSQIFGDGKGNYPEGSYLNMVLIHSVSTMADVDAVYTGLNHPDPNDEVIGALAALKDYRDGTNLTGLNPKEEKLVRHIGFSGHYSPAVMMEMIQRDNDNLLDGMLVAVNANDKLQFNMQNNVIPVAKAKNMGIIAMKVFADGAMYTKPANWSWQSDHVVCSVGSPDLPSRPLIQYSLSTPGIATAIIGTGHIDQDPMQCQLTQNLSAAQIKPLGLSETERRSIEAIAHQVKDGKTNYFQAPAQELTAIQQPEIEIVEGDTVQTRLKWNSAYAGDSPLVCYNILRDGQLIGTVDHVPQINKIPFIFEEPFLLDGSHRYQIVAVDRNGRTNTVSLMQPSG